MRPVLFRLHKHVPTMADDAAVQTLLVIDGPVPLEVPVWKVSLPCHGLQSLSFYSGYGIPLGSSDQAWIA